MAENGKGEEIKVCAYRLVFGKTFAVFQEHVLLYGGAFNVKSDSDARSC